MDRQTPRGMGYGLPHSEEHPGHESHRVTIMANTGTKKPELGIVLGGFLGWQSTCQTTVGTYICGPAPAYKVSSTSTQW